MSVYNGVMMQYFHWYTASEDNLWRQLSENAPALAKAGITSVWLPPAYKGANGANDVGYGVYDLFDLGEFDQKGSVRAKYGFRDEYLNAIKRAQQSGIQVYADIVFIIKWGRTIRKNSEPRLSIPTTAMSLPAKCRPFRPGLNSLSRGAQKIFSI